MAEQEACTALVDEATRGEEAKTPTTPPISGQLEGESQLLPLLQGLLDAPANDVTPDSGTESGEDQRSNLIAEVQGALEKLSNSLQSHQTDITAERRCSLLQLVTKLQAGLSGTGKKDERRASTVSTSGRFQKKKNKQARHTVGVSKEELADARKLIEQIALNELTPSGSVKHLSKQNSESSVPNSSASSSYRNVHNKVKNAVAKPFSSSNSTSSSVQTPTENFDGIDALFNTDEKKLERNISVDSNVSIKSAYKAVQHAATTKVKRQQSNQVDENSDEDESSTIKATSVLENASINPIYNKPSSHEEKSSRFDTQKRLRMKRANTIDIPKNLKFYEDEDDSDSEHETKRRESSYALKTPLHVGNPHTKKIVPTFEPKTDSDKKFLAFLNKHNENGANKGSMWSNTDTIWNNRFGNIKNNFEKKSSQEQAKNFWKSNDDNIKPLNGNQFGPKISRRSARNLQLMFEEKQKEIQRNIPNHYNPYQNRNAVHVAPQKHNTSLVQNRNDVYQSHVTANQNNVVKTGTLVQDHYKSGRNAVPQQQNVAPRKHSAGQHNVVAASNHIHNYENEQHVSPHNVVTGTLQLKTEPEKHYRIIPQPLPVNQFSHAPQSAFKPIKKTPQSAAKRSSMVFSPEGNEIFKSQIKDNNGPSFLYSPKPLGSSVESSTVTSPVVSKPWAATAGTSRVLSLAASKFEQTPAQEPPKPRRVTKEAAKVFVPTNNQTVDRSPTYLPSKSEPKSSTVRKLSGNYETYESNVKAQPQTYQIRTSVVESQYTPPVRAPAQAAPVLPPQNYTIRYDQPTNYSIRYDQKPQNYPMPHQQTQNYHQPQNYSIRYDQPQNQNYQQQTPTTQNYSVRYNKPQPIQEDIKKVAPQPKSPKAPPVQAIEPVVQPPKAQRQISEESVHEHIAVSSRVMSGPVSQQAVTVTQKSPKNRDQHDIDAAFNLKNSLQKVTPKTSPGVSPARSPVSQSFSYKPRDNDEGKNSSLSQSFKYKSEIENSESFKYKPSDCPKPTVSPSSFRFRSTFEETPPKNCGVVKPMQQATPIYNNTAKKPTNQFHIPMINVKSPESPRVLSKSDSWHDICLAHQNTNQKPVQKPGPVKSKSSHSLAVPKLFEAGMSKEEMLNKRRTMEAFLTGSKPCETETVGGKSVKRSINRVKTSQKVSTQSRTVSGGLSRSRTLPDMICPELLDESNVDKAFDQLFESS